MDNIRKTLGTIIYETLNSFFTLGIIPEFYTKEDFLLKSFFTFCSVKYKNENRISGTYVKIPAIEGIQTTLINSIANHPLYDILTLEKTLKSSITFYFAKELTEVKDPNEISLQDGIKLTYNNYSSFLLPEERKYDNISQELDSLCERAGVVKGCWKDTVFSKIEKMEFTKLEVKYE